MKTLRSVSRLLSPVGLTVMRVCVGLIMAVHGWTKLTDFELWTQIVSLLGVPVPQVFAGLSVAAELAGGVGLVLGLFTPVAAFGLVVDLAVAIGLVHAGNGLFVQNGGFEYALLMAVVAFFFLLRGGGPFSLDRALFGERKPRAEPEPTVPFGHEAHV